MRLPAAYLVWNPAHRLPTYKHETFEGAETEAVRLRERHADTDGEFWVMAPVRSKSAASAAKAFSDGKAEGLAQARAEIMLAEGRTDRLSEELAALQRRMNALCEVSANASEFQSIVADCLLWFDGFMAAQAHKDGWERPHTPSRDKLCEINSALQRVVRAKAGEIEDEDIPF